MIYLWKQGSWLSIVPQETNRVDRSKPSDENSGASSHSSRIYMIATEDISEDEEFIPVTPEAVAVMANGYPGHAVLDSGATETIASLDALEEIMLIR